MFQCWGFDFFFSFFLLLHCLQNVSGKGTVLCFPLSRDIITLRSWLWCSTCARGRIINNVLVRASRMCLYWTVDSCDDTSREGKTHSTWMIYLMASRAFSFGGGVRPYKLFRLIVISRKVTRDQSVSKLHHSAISWPSLLTSLQSTPRDWRRMNIWEIHVVLMPSRWWQLNWNLVVCV